MFRGKLKGAFKMGFYESVLVFICITVISVTGLYVLTGLTGLFSLGHAAFLSLGAYVAAVLVKNYDLPFIAAAIIAVLFTVFVGVLVGIPTVRLRRDYIALVTFGFGEALRAILNQLVNITGGAMGLSGIPRLTTLPMAIGSVIVVIILARNFKCSKFGRQCIAVRDDELSAKSLGMNATRVKMTAYLLSVAFTAYAGVLYAFYISYLEPGHFGWTKSAEWTIMVFFGGINSLTGAVFAGLFLTSLTEILRFAAEWRIATYCVLVLFILNFRPAGVMGEYELSVRSFKDILSWIKKGWGK